jgi:hypothetical protein
MPVVNSLPSLHLVAAGSSAWSSGVGTTPSPGEGTTVVPVIVTQPDAVQALQVEPAQLRPGSGRPMALPAGATGAFRLAAGRFARFARYRVVGLPAGEVTG